MERVTEELIEAVSNLKEECDSVDRKIQKSSVVLKNLEENVTTLSQEKMKLEGEVASLSFTELSLVPEVSSAKDRQERAVTEMHRLMVRLKRQQALLSASDRLSADIKRLLPDVKGRIEKYHQVKLTAGGEKLLDDKIAEKSLRLSTMRSELQKYDSLSSRLIDANSLRETLRSRVQLADAEGDLVIGELHDRLMEIAGDFGEFQRTVENSEIELV